MINQEIVNYIKSQLARGVDKESIRQLLLEHNWPAQDVDDSLKALEEVPVPAPAGNVSVPAQSTVQPMAQPATAALPAIGGTFPFLWIGLGALAIGFVISFFSGGMTVLIANVLISLAGAGVLMGIAKLFKVPGKLFAKTLFILGVGGLIGPIFGWINTAISMPTWLAIVLAIACLVGGLFLVKMVYGIGWGKTIGLLVVNVIAMVITFFIVFFISGLIAAALLLGGAFSDIQSSGFDIQPSENIVAAPAPTPISQDQITVWKTIKLGTYEDAEALRAAIFAKRYIVTPSADDIMSQDAFTVVDNEVEIDLVKLTAGELGLSSGNTDQIHAKAMELGLDYCPAEVGPQLRLQYEDQPENSVDIYIDMGPIASTSGQPRIFNVSNFFGIKLDAQPYTTFSGERLTFVFCYPNI